MPKVALKLLMTERKKDRSSKTTKPTDFADSISKILSRPAKQRAILSRSGVEKRLADEKLESKAKKKLAAEKHKLQSVGRTIPSEGQDISLEASMKRQATRGGSHHL